MPIVDFGQEREAEENEFVIHPEGHEGMFVANKDAAKVLKNGNCCGIEIVGTVDGSNVREYLTRYEDKKAGSPTFGQWGFADFRVNATAKAFGFRKHGDLTANPNDILRVKVGSSAPCRLKIHTYGKCRMCKASSTEQTSGACRCGGIIETRQSNEIDRWLDPVDWKKQGRHQSPTATSRAANVEQPKPADTNDAAEPEEDEFA